MKTFFVLLVTCGILALQFHFGLRKRMYLGAILPLIFLILFGAMSYEGKTLAYVGIGAGCIGALVVVWSMGYVKSSKYEKDELESMKKKDI